MHTANTIPWDRPCCMPLASHVMQIKSRETWVWELLLSARIKVPAPGSGSEQRPDAHRMLIHTNLISPEYKRWGYNYRLRLMPRTTDRKFIPRNLAN